MTAQGMKAWLRKNCSNLLTVNSPIPHEERGSSGCFFLKYFRDTKKGEKIIKGLLSEMQIFEDI